MTDPDELNDARRERARQSLSKLMDGEAADLDPGCAAWREDAGARADWHAYHLIGDVMRSSELARPAADDAAFVARLRVRLADEPVVLAHAVVAPRGPARARRAWLAPAAVAAGFVAVAGALVVTRVSGPDGERMARSGAPSSMSATPVAAQGNSLAGTVAAPARVVLEGVGEGALLRNADLDRYLAAHRQYGPTSTLTAPGGVVRSAVTAEPGR